VELARALRLSARLAEQNRLLGRDGFPELIAESPAMQPVLRLMERVGPSDAAVLVTGEHGTGKELVAQWLHASSPRAPRSLVTVNVGGLSEGVFESELFGHVKGAFTDAKADRTGRFELADGGTLFLDEIANVPLSQQAKLLRVLQTGEVERVGSSRTRRVDVRVIAATNADLKTEVATGRFREDLLFRLNTVEIRLPPLRERREDILPIATQCLRRQGARYRKPLTGFDRPAMEALHAHGWPGNVRELEHAMERAVLLADGRTIDVEAIPLGTDQANAVWSDVPDDAATLADRKQELRASAVDRLERLFVLKALRASEWNVSQAARAVGMARPNLHALMRKHGITSPEGGEEEPEEGENGVNP
jgi:DNA-binding NtrC family response regulator